MQTFIAEIRADLKANADEQTKQSAQRYFKEQAIFYGVKTGTVEKIAKKHWPHAKTYSKLPAFRVMRGTIEQRLHRRSFHSQHLDA